MSLPNNIIYSLSVPYQGAQLYPQGGYGQSGAGPWNQYPYSQAYGQTGAAQVYLLIIDKVIINFY